MPSIQKDDQQLRALNEISADLETAKKINAIIANPPASFDILPIGKKKESVRMDSAFTERILALLKADKQKIAKDVQRKATKFRIELDTSDLAILADDSAEANAVETSETAGSDDVNDEEEELDNSDIPSSNGYY